MQCTHSNQLADVGMLQMNKAEAKRYEEENITIMSMIISSSHSYIYYIFLKFYTIAGFFFYRMLRTQTKQDFSGRVHSA